MTAAARREASDAVRRATVRLGGIAIVCPACRGPLARRAGDTPALRCDACAHDYPVVEGIPDLRRWPDPYMGVADDHHKARLLAARTAAASFASSVEAYYELAASAVPPSQAQRFTRGVLAAGGRAGAWLEGWEQAAGGPPRAGALLELGCGTAPVLGAAGGRYARRIGVDIALRWLIVARRRLAEAGIQAPLVCACAEALPFLDDEFERVVADAVLEGVRDQPAAAGEAARVLRPGGWLFASTPNRFSLGPDPHVGLPLGGWLPKAVVDRYIRARGGAPPHRRLLSALALRRLLGDAGFAPVRLSAPPIPAAARAGLGSAERAALAGYDLARATAPGRVALMAVGPLLHAAARKPGPAVA